MSVSAGRSAMTMGHAGILADSMSFEGPVLGGDSVDMHRAIATLCCNVFVQGIPSNSLDIVRMFDGFPDAFACGSGMFNRMIEGN